VPEAGLNFHPAQPLKTKTAALNPGAANKLKRKKDLGIEVFFWNKVCLVLNRCIDRKQFGELRL